MLALDFELHHQVLHWLGHYRNLAIREGIRKLTPLIPADADASCWTKRIHVAPRQALAILYQRTRGNASRLQPNPVEAHQYRLRACDFNAKG